MLVHYTSDIGPATNILRSGEFWFKKMKFTKDNQEINHFNMELDRVVYTLDLIQMAEKNLVRMRAEPDNSMSILKEFLYEATFYKEHYKETSIGGVLADFLRENTYLVCFTEGESEFHTTEYGGIGFVFENNPFLQLGFIRRYKLLEEKVYYFDAQKIHTLQMEYSELITNGLAIPEEEYTPISLLKEYIRQLKRGHREYESLLKDIVNGAKETAGLDFLDLFANGSDIELREIVGFITREVNEKRSRAYSSLAGTRKLSKKDISKKYERMDDIKPGLAMNLISCFLKDNRFKSDNETRILALPKNRGAINNDFDDHLSIPFDRTLLKKIVVNSEQKDEDIETIKGLLNELGLDQIEVVSLEAHSV
nr:hypothetical protein [Fredinandcohnia onubensis]